MFLSFLLFTDLSDDSGAKTKLFTLNDELKSSGFPSLPPIGKDTQAGKCTLNINRAILNIV